MSTPETQEAEPERIDRKLASRLRQDKEFQRFKSLLHTELVEQLDLSKLDSLHDEQTRRDVRLLATRLLHEMDPPFSHEERLELVRQVMQDVFGLGPLEDLLADDTISDILVNRCDQTYIEVHGRLEERSDIQFRDEAHLRQVIDRIVSQVGRHVDEASPRVDARLPDGSRVNAVIPPLALDGSNISIRRFGKDVLKAVDLIDKYHAVTWHMVAFLMAAIRARLNIVISGGTGSGKTTLLNMLSSFVPKNERIVTIEDAAELRLQQPHVVRLESRPPNIQGVGEVAIRELVINALRMRPDRIVVGECRGPEAIDMVQAMNTGHDGSLTTLHANTPGDAMLRLETMVLMAGYDLPVRAIRQQLVSAIDLIVQAARLTGGDRKIISICEVTGMEGEQITMLELFRFEKTGVDTETGRQAGVFKAMGNRPERCWEKLQASGGRIDASWFNRQDLPVGLPAKVKAALKEML